MEIIHGFEIIDNKPLEEIDGEYTLLEHKKSGAKLVFLKNDDTNRVFMIGFPTPSKNSTGVAHILEHSTLNGSEKYPVKEPFVELIKGSLNTFLNAMTYSDKTVYPIASTNEKDFRNLTDVYLDAVLKPNIYKNPFTFMQEGWHYHLEDKDQPLTYNGVVYNEMQGVFSDPNSILEEGIYKTLLPDTIYAQESGGHPDHIPELTYEDFLNFHKKFYHPSNSYIFVYGDNDLEEQLEYLDSRLKEYDREEVDTTIELQEIPEEIVEETFYYPINADESIKDKDMIALNFALPADLSSTEIRALHILTALLLNNSSSILKSRLLKEELASDVHAMFDTTVKQPVLSIILKDTDVNKKDRFIEVVQEELNKLVNEGIPEKELDAIINSSEFKILEMINGEGIAYPKGLMIGLGLFENWLYGNNPADTLNILEQLEDIKKLKENKAFEDLLKKYLIDNKHQSIVLLKPDKELAGKREKELEQKLADYKASLSVDELENLVNQTLKLIENQNTPDTKEALETIPRLKVSEIDKQITPINYETYEKNNIPVIYVENKKGDIIYLFLSFNLLNINQEDIKYLRLLDELIAEVSTKNYNYKDLNVEFDRYTGGISSDIDVISHIDKSGFTPRFNVKISFKKENINKAFELLNEVINNSKYSEKKIIQDVIKAFRIDKKRGIQSQGNYYADRRMRSKLSLTDRYIEELSGIEYYKFLSDLDDNYDERWNNLQSKLEEVAKEVFNINNLTVSLSCKKDVEEEVLDKVIELSKDFTSNKTTPVELVFEDLPKKEAFITPGNVMYNAKGGLVDLGDDYNYGSLKVLKTILSMDYLWNKIRVLGGAYGSGFGFNRNGDFSMTSFRDPNLEKTYENFDEAVNYIENLDLPKEELDKYIIGTISTMDQPISTRQTLSIATSDFISGSNNKLRQDLRDQVLSTNLEDIKNNSKVVKEFLDQDNIVTIGTETAIMNNKELFDNIEFIK